MNQEDANDSEFAQWVRKEVFPQLKVADAFISITPDSPEQVDIKYCVELGLSIMLDKPIVCVIQAGAKVPEKLAMVADKFVELDTTNIYDEDFDGEDLAKRMADAVQELKDEGKIE